STTTPVSLVAGRSYYFEASFQEGGGGDWMELDWNPNNTGLALIPPENVRYCIDPIQVPFTISQPSPNPVHVTECRSATFSVVVNAPGQAITLKWQRSDDGGNSWNDIVPAATG